ncbi:MAG: type II 3-dehydroquinate dehydratase [Desulfovibrio sp.]|nr:type II 3-dehydroquinate dehydratase [Desulfovibrio sp.]
MSRLLLLHGVNLNMFGRRDPKQYGTHTLEYINNACQKLARELGAELTIFQSNDEGRFITRIHESLDEGFDGVVINAGAWTHTSLAIADALAILSVPIVEVHMSNIHAREPIRHTSLISPLCAGSIVGFGVDSYLLGIRALISLLLQKTDKTNVR